MSARVKPLKHGEIVLMSVLPHGEQGVFFSVRYPFRIEKYRTSREGKGLWKLCHIKDGPHKGEPHWLQVRRVSQFTLKQGSAHLEKRIMAFLTGDRFKLERPLPVPEQVTVFDILQ